MRLFWVKSNGRVQELTWEQYKDLYMNEARSTKIKRILIRCDNKTMIITHGRNVVVTPTQSIKQIITTLGEETRAKER
jgi:hypothetical protein